MNAFVEARFYQNRTIPNLGMLVAVDTYGRLFRLDRINDEWQPGEDFELVPTKTMSWQDFVDGSRKLQGDMPQEYPMGNDAPVQ